jgi:ATP-binding cassette subfamily F protein 3
VFEPIAPLSGGEKSRLVLALTAYRQPNLLLLDEPTNHLDLDMRQALAVALQDYDGAVVLVSHDRHLLRTVVDELFVVHGGRLERFDGDLDDYARWLAGEASAAAAASGIHRSAPGQRSDGPVEGDGAEGLGSGIRESDSAEARRQRKRLEAEQRNLLSPLRAAVASAERELDRLHRELAELQAALTAPELYSPDGKERLRELLERQARLARQTESAEADWLERSERLEAKMQELTAGADRAPSSR